MLCTEAVLVKQQNASFQAVPLFCKRWHCQICRPRRIRRLKFEARDGKPNRFLTLTHRPQPGETPGEAARALVRHWRELRRRIKRRYKLKSVPFLAVLEPHKSGFPHLHIMLRCRWLEQSWLSEQMAQMADSPVVGIEKIESTRKAAAYVAKYLSKAPEQFDGCKRYWQSPDYASPQRRELKKRKPEKGNWRVAEISWRRFVEAIITCYDRPHVEQYCIVWQGDPPTAWPWRWREP